MDGAGPVRDCDRQLWRVVLTMTPSYLRPFVKELLVFDADPASSQGIALGDAVPADGKDASRWRLSLAPNVGDEADVVLSVAHQVGHLLALNPNQLATPQPTTCATLDPGLRCLGDTSYLVEFVEWAKSLDITDEAKRNQALNDFYVAHHTELVTASAAVDPSEDFAESFGLWCAFDDDNPGVTTTSRAIRRTGSSSCAGWRTVRRTSTAPSSPTARRCSR